MRALYAVPSFLDSSLQLHFHLFHLVIAEHLHFHAVPGFVLFEDEEEVAAVIDRFAVDGEEDIAHDDAAVAVSVGWGEAGLFSGATLFNIGEEGLVITISGDRG